MMNVTTKANPQDVAGALGLLAFLADPEACAARLAELYAVVDQINATEAAAVSVKAEADEKFAAATAAQDIVNAAVIKTAEAKVALQEEGARLQAVDIELSHREAKIVEQELAQKVLLDQIQDVRNDLSVSEAMLLKQGDEVAALKADYEGKLAQFRDIAR